MKTNYSSKKLISIRFLVATLCFLCTERVFSQVEDTIVTQEQDSTQLGVQMGKMELPDPPSISSQYTYDPVLDRYVFTRSLGDFNLSYPLILTPEEYQRLVLEESMKLYFKQKIDAIEGKKEGSTDERKNLLPTYYVNSNFFESVFGGNTIDIIPQGSVAVDLGLRYQKNDNPSLSPRNRQNFSFDFDQRISVSLLGKIGTRLQVTANYDTQSTFDFQNLIKLEYTPNEDDILQKIEIGNVSMPLNSSLITGAQNLFGVKAQLKFGRTTVTGVFSEQRSQSNSVVSQGGGTLEEFEVFALDYDEDRHFFLSQYFRDQYDRVIQTYPYINTQVQITRVEIWVTNRNLNTQNVRNIVALQDLGEFTPENTRLALNSNDPPGFFQVNSNGNNELARNDANQFNPRGINDPSIPSVLTAAVRDISTVSSGFGILNPVMQEGFDYAILETARKLEPNEYTLHTQLGYISLNQKLSNDEVLGVAFQYTVGGQVYQVGEFANDGIDASDPGTDPNNPVINNNALVVKMLKSNVVAVEDPIWDLMMKNIYDTGAFQLNPQDFVMNILYVDPTPLNYINPADSSSPLPSDVAETPLLQVFNLDKLNLYNDPQAGGDGFFDFVPGVTVIPQYGKLIFTSVEPFGSYLFRKLASGSEDYDDPPTYNNNQAKYVYRDMYRLTKAAALENAEQNKFQLKGRYTVSGGDGIAVGAFNIPPGSVRVTAGGRVLVEGVDYTVNYQIGRVTILDESLRASNIPIEISVENNSVFGQQTRRFTAMDVEHQFTPDFLVGATLMNLNERPLTQKANYGLEPVNNTMFGLRANYSTEVPFLTRMVNHLPNIDTDVPSNISMRGEFAYLLPNSPKASDFDGEPTAYLDDFEGAQVNLDMRGTLAWSLSSTPIGVTNGDAGDNDLRRGFNRAKLSWYTIDPIFYTIQRPDGITDDDVSTNETRRIFISEIFPQQDLAQGQFTVQTTLDLAYYPSERGPYNFTDTNQSADLNLLPDPEQNWAGITRPISSTNFEQANVEYIQFWLLDTFTDSDVPEEELGELTFNLGNISEDVLSDRRKQYENGLPGTNSNVLTQTSVWGRTPSSQSLVYAFDANDTNRALQDVGFDGLADADEKITNDPFKSRYTSLEDPSADNFQFYVSASGDVLERYKNYNGTEGNSPVSVSNTNRGSTTLPDVEDINRDQTMNTIDSYFEYRIPIRKNMDAQNHPFITDVRVGETTLPNSQVLQYRWLQFKIPITPSVYEDATSALGEYFERVGGIQDVRSIRFMRMYLGGFAEPTVFRFGTLDLIRGDWRRYTQALNPDVIPDPAFPTVVDINTVNILENETRFPIPYVLPPGVFREQLNNNNTIVRQNEQSLSFTVRNLAPKDSRGVFKNLDLDMRQYKKLKMFIHAEGLERFGLEDGELIGFLRIGTDFSQNYYQIEVPLRVTPWETSGSDPEAIWPTQNNIDVTIEALSKIKAFGLGSNSLDGGGVFYYDIIDGEPVAVNEFQERQFGVMRVAIKGFPSLGRIRAMMIGLKSGAFATDSQGNIIKDGKIVSGEVWFNELRLAELDNDGGWAAIAAVDANVADFATVSATGKMSTSGFGNVDMTPNERSREDFRQFDLVTNINLGQLLPNKWGIQLPFNYAVGETLITPEFDPLYQDIKLDDLLGATQDSQERDAIQERAEDYTKRKSINFIGVRKSRGPEQKPHPYDIENFDFSYSYNETLKSNFEISDYSDQTARVGANYNYGFQANYIEPLKDVKFLNKSAYLKWLSELNLNPLPTNVSVTSNINRTFNQRQFRQTDLDLNPDNLGLPEFQQRNYLFNWAYTVNHNLSRSLRFNFTAANSRIVKNYFFIDEDNIERVDTSLGLWDGFWDVGDPNRHATNFGLTWDIPLNKIPIFKFINATYNYSGSYEWRRGSDALASVTSTNGQTLGIVNTVQNTNLQSLNASLSMDNLYRYLGLVRKTGNKKQAPRTNNAPATDQRTGSTPSTNKNSGTGIKVYNTFIDVLTMVKRIQVNYSKNDGTVLPGYLPSVGFIGTTRPSVGFIFGSQADVRYEAAKRGWLTEFPEFNEQYQRRKSRQLDLSAAVSLIPDLTIDLLANRTYAEALVEQFRVEDGQYIPLTPNLLGSFDISTILIGTSFSKNDEFTSAAFQDFKDNRLVVARRLALERDPTLDLSDPNNLDQDGYPKGYGKTNQAVLIPSFLAAYRGADADGISFSALRDTPLPNWNIKYTGLMRLGAFKKTFRRFSLAHGYRASYTINQFRTNLDDDPLDQNGNFRNDILYSNLNLVEQFNPLLRVDMEMKNSIRMLAELRTDRGVSLSLDNNLVTDTKGHEYIVGLGYRFADVRFRTGSEGNRTNLGGDINLKGDLSLRDNITVIRSLDVENNQVTAGQNIWSLKLTADYALTQGLSVLFFYDHTFSKFAVSTAFPQTTIRSGFTIRYNFGN